MNNELTATEQPLAAPQADHALASTELSVPETLATAPSSQPKRRPSEMNNVFRRSLRAKGHHLKPIVQIGQGGISDGVIEATQAALEQHDLIKVSINGESPTERKSGATILADATGAHVIQVIGRVILLYRETEPKEKQTKAVKTVRVGKNGKPIMTKKQQKLSKK